MRYNKKASVLTDTIYKTICDNPGISVWQIGKLIGINYRTIDNNLPSLEKDEYLIYEDDDGKLYPYIRQDV